MLARSSRLLASCGRLARQFNASASALEGELAQSSEEYAAKVAQISNNEPGFPADFLKKYGKVEVGASDGPTPSKIKLTFVSPHKIIMSNKEVLNNLRHMRYSKTA